MAEGGFALADYDLRITERCAVRDLGLSIDALDAAITTLRDDTPVGHLVAAFIDKRSAAPEGEDVMEGLRARKLRATILRRGERLRGLTWFDREDGVVWLVAAHLMHRSGEGSDAYPYFRSLGPNDLLPTKADFERLFGSRAIAAADATFDQVPALIIRAAATRGKEVSGRVGRIRLSMVMTADLPPHLHLAVSLRWDQSAHAPDPPADWLLALLAACYRHSFTDWSSLPYDRSFPTRELRSDETAFADLITDWSDPA